MDGEQQVRGKSPEAGTRSDLLRPVLAALAGAGENERYRLLADLLRELADAGPAGRPGDSDEQLGTISRKVQALGEEKASLQDKCATLKADLDHRAAQLEAEQTRGHELQMLNEEQRGRLDSLQKQVRDFEAQLTAKSAELHKAHVEHDRELLEAQRAATGAGDRSKLDRLQESKRELGKEVEDLRSQMEQLRSDKDEQIARLNDELEAARSSAGDAKGVSFEALWARLAAAKPPLVDGKTQPTEQCAQRLVDAFVELVRFVDDFDKLIRPFLSKYTKHHQPVKVPWDVYAKRDDTLKTVQQTLAVVGGKPIGVVKIRLRGLYAWTEAAMIACDAAIESLASEMHPFLMGPHGAGSDPNRTIRDFLRDDGHELFLQHIRELRGTTLAEAFGRRG